ncbi:MAG TPA: histidine kinase [Puia sp.]|uniref:sensor histidine kinase n=1 Tax=Puia sp. TaxID=2045100 RepID=UPI002CBD8F06|nr:histidine kinase [Puia sp.]HVU96484.1 histidine kinase [Puia sp.]
MNCPRLLAGLLLSLLCITVSGQEYGYAHYDISEGLAGSTVYCIAQDRDGFIWVGTETGVSRFDGTHFHNYTAIDGLPDVEILEMFGDSKGRVWMAPFRKSVCYAYKGKIYNQENDPLLRKIRLAGNVVQFAGNEKGDILIAEKNRLHWVGTDGDVREFDSVAGRPVRGCVALASDGTGHFLAQVDSMIYRFSGGEFTPFYPISIRNAEPFYISLTGSGLIWRYDSACAVIHSFLTNKTVKLPFESYAYNHIGYSQSNDSLFYDNQFAGSLEYNLYTGKTRRFLPGRQVSRTFRDATGNLWFTTLDQGLYRLNSEEFQTIHLSTPGYGRTGICGLEKIGDRLYAGSNRNTFYTFHPPAMDRWTTTFIYTPSKNLLLSFGQIPDGSLMVGSAVSIAKLDKKAHRIGLAPVSVKSVYKLTNQRWLVASVTGVFLFDLPGMKIVDTFWRERSTVTYSFRDTIYVGTLNGLYSVAADRTTYFLGTDIPFFKKRISGIASSPDGTLWVSSYDAGVTGYRNGKVIATLTRKQGLTSDICRTIVIHDNALWIGTDKGLNKVFLCRPGYPVLQYTSQDGLGSDIVNCVLADGSIIYVGTPAGLSFFDEGRVNRSEECPLYLLSVLNSGKEHIADSNRILIPYTDRFLRVEFAGISYRSVGGIRYRYRLLGLDTVWRTTPESWLEYQSLPSGSYELQIQAENKFGRQSGIRSLAFEVATPWWQTIWFQVLIFLSAVAVTWLIISLRIRQIRKREKEREKLSHKVMELEQMALKAQMNPHFIFNCLNSIQQYVFDQDVFAVNKYLTGFSKLIRATLHNSSRELILLSEEVSYLSGYLSLEKLRFKEKMDYWIEVDPALQGAAFLVPPMLIQPYVENSMRHGLRHKTTGRGIIHVRFRHAGTRLSVAVEDNGIGRKAAAALKTREHIEYQSKGMSLTADRIRIINARYGEAIHVEVIDLEDDAGIPVGTRVVIDFPMFHLISKHDTL